MKSYTNTEQSKKLAKILSIKSADMYYERVYFENKQSDWFVKFGTPIKSDDIIPCWSLSALLDVLSYPLLSKGLTGWRCDVYNKKSYIGKSSNNPVGTCVEMIIKLNELNKL